MFQRRMLVASLLLTAWFVFPIEPAMVTVNAQSMKKSQDGKRSVRLPNNFGQIGLSQQQEQTIREIRRSYVERIEDLERQLAALKAEESKKMNDVLTTDQKAQLKKLRAKYKK